MSGKWKGIRLFLRRCCQQQYPWEATGPLVRVGLLRRAGRFQLVFGGAFDHCGILCFDVIPEKTSRPDCWHQFGAQGAPGCKHFLFRFGQQHLRSIFPCRPKMPFVCQAGTVLNFFLDFVLLLFIHCLFYTPSCCVSAVRTAEGVGGGRDFPAGTLKLVFQVFCIRPCVSSH